MIFLALWGAFEMVLPEGGEAVVNLVLENQTDTVLKEPWVFVFSKPSWLSVSPDSVITKSLARGERVGVRLRLKGDGALLPDGQEDKLVLRVLVRNGEVAPDFIEFSIRREPYHLASLVPWLLSREYTFTHTLTEHYDYYPIVFLHGTLTGWSYWLYSDPYGTIMTHLEGFRGYRLYNDGIGYSADNSPGEPTVDSIYPKRWVFNISYYWWSAGEVQPGAAGSAYTIAPCDALYRGNYHLNLNYTEYGQIVASRIKTILSLTYSDHVHIVAHSYGSLVARAAMKWYGCQEKVARFLSIGGVNHPIDESIAQNIAQFFWELFSSSGGIPGSWRYGDGAEMDKDIQFSSNPDNCTSEKPYLDFMANNWAGATRYATIAGTVDPTILNIGNEDGLVNTETVYLDGAEFNALHHSTHGSASASTLWTMDTYGEWSLTANKYSLEFIKNWIIEGSVTRSGNVNVESIALLGPTWNCTDNLLIIVKMNEANFNKILSMQVFLLSINGTLYATDGCSYREAQPLDNDHWLFHFFDEGVEAMPGFNYLPITIYNLSGAVYEDTLGIQVDCGGG